MSQQTINVGAAPSDGSGDPLRISFEKINSNFTELYNITGNISGNSNVSPAVFSVAGKQGNVLLDVTNITGAASQFYVTSQINLALNILANNEDYGSVAEVVTVTDDYGSI